MKTKEKRIKMKMKINRENYPFGLVLKYSLLALNISLFTLGASEKRNNCHAFKAIHGTFRKN